MAINLRYDIDPLVSGAAAHEGERSRVAQRQSLADRELAQRDRHFDETLNLRAQQAGLDDDFRWAGLGQNAYQDQANRQFRYDTAALDYAQGQDRQALAQQELQQRADAQQETTDRQRMQLMAELQKDQQRRTFEQALSSQKAINDYKGYTSQNQFDEAVGQWESQFGMDWGFPQRSIAEQQGQDSQAKRQQFVGGLAGLTGLAPELVDSLVIEGEGGMPMLTVPPQLITGVAESKLSDQRMREIKDKDIEFKREQDAVEFDREAKKTEWDRAADQRDHQFDILKEKQKAKLAFAKDHAKWQTQKQTDATKSKDDDTYTPTAGAEPKLSDYMIDFGESKPPVPVTSPAEVKAKLASGELNVGDPVQLPDGRIGKAR